MAGSKQKTHSAASAHERLNEYAKSAAETVKKSTVSEASESGKTFLRQLLGLEISGGSKDHGAHAETSKSSEQKVSSGLGIIDLVVFENVKTEKKASKEKAPRIEAAMNYSGEIAKSSERATRAEMNEMSQSIQQIKAELQQLLSSSKVLQMEFAEVTMEQTPVEGGKYHVNFFDWMLIVIRQARQKVEDSGAWLNTMKGKGKGGKAKPDFSIANGQMHQSGERTTIQNSVG